MGDRIAQLLGPLKRYRPLIALGCVLALLVVLVPQPAVVDRGAAGDLRARDLDTTTPDADPLATEDPSEVDADTDGIPTTDTADPTPAQDRVTGQGAPTPEPEDAFRCFGDRRIDSWFFYRPPACEWDAATNFGGTWGGVTEDTIRVGVYLWAEDNPELAAASFAATGMGDDDTMFYEYETLNRWFASQPYELYGREVELVRLKCDGRNDDDAAMRACAVKADEELDLFAVLWEGESSALGEELASRGILLISPLTRDDSFVESWAPHYWHVFPAAGYAATTLAEWMGTRLVGHNAQWAGDSAMQLEERAFGFVVIGEPNEPGVQTFQRELDRYDVPVARFITYDLDVPQAQLIASNVIAQLREAGANTVVCVCDPLFPSFLMSEASRQLYFPEWIPFGWLLDTDQFGQLYDQEQMENAYTLSWLPVPVPYEQTDWWRAWKEVSPDDEPNVSASAFFALLMMLYQGAHMAGPELNPVSFAEGMFTYPATGGTPTHPQMSYGPKEIGPRTFTDYAVYDDVNQIWWDRSAPSPAAEGSGAWRHVDGGARFLGGVGAWPGTEPRMFDPEGAPSYYDDGNPVP